MIIWVWAVGKRKNSLCLQCWTRVDILDANLSILLLYMKYFIGSARQRASSHSWGLLLHTFAMSVWSIFFALSSIFSIRWPTTRHAPLHPLCLPSYHCLCSSLMCSLFLAFSSSEVCWLLRLLPLTSLCFADAITALRSTCLLGTFEGRILVWLVNQFINSIYHVYYDLGMVRGLEIHRGTEFVSTQWEAWVLQDGIKTQVSNIDDISLYCVIIIIIIQPLWAQFHPLQLRFTLLPFQHCSQS